MDSWYFYQEQGKQERDKLKLKVSGTASDDFGELFIKPKILERETGFEPATSTLARLHSTTELLPLAEKHF